MRKARPGGAAAAAFARARWRPYSQQLPRPDPRWRGWLLDAGSLTRRLRLLSRKGLSVQLVSEGWQQGLPPALVSAFAPHLRQQRMWARQVVLCGDGEPWVVACSLIPQSSLRGALRCLPKLGTQPLGAYLFRHKGLQRGALEVAAIDQGWARRSVFVLQGQPIMVAELFLPTLLQHAALQGRSVSYVR